MGCCSTCYDVLVILLVILLPPLGVFLKYGCQCEFWVALLLTLLGYLPGVIYGLYVVIVAMRSGEDRVVYYQNQ